MAERRAPQRNFSILRRLVLAYLLLILVTATVTGIAALRISATTQELELTGAVLLPLVAEIGELRALTAGTRTYLDQVVPGSDLRSRLQALGGSFMARRQALASLSEIAEARWHDRRTFPSEHLRRGLLLLSELRGIADRTAFLTHLDEMDREMRLVLLLSRAELKTRSRDAAQAGGREVVWLITLAGLGALGVLILTLTLITPLRSLDRLRHAVEAVEAGRPVAKLDAGRNEVGAVIQAVQRMAAAVQGRETALKDERSRLRRAQSETVNLIESVPLALIVIDQEGRVTRINHACRRLFRSDPAAFIGKALANTPAGALIDAPSRTIAAVLHGEVDDWQAEADFGKGRRLAAHLNGLRDREGSLLAPPITGAILVLEEVTRRHDAEVALRRHERLAATGRLAAQVVHEVRNPLSTIGLAAQMLSEDLPGGADPEGWLDQIRSEAARLERVTQAYLQLARLPDPQLAPTPLAPLVADLIGFMNDPRLAAEIAPEAIAFVDADGLRGALLNLIQNALQAVDEASGKVALSCEISNDEVRLIIDDNGPGIPQSVLDQLGDAFIDGHPNGTGLGLALAMEVLGAQGGRLEVDRRPEGGTRCCAVLPLAEATGKDALSGAAHHQGTIRAERET